MRIVPLNSKDVLLIKRALKYVKPYRIKFAITFVCILSDIGFGIIQPLVWGNILSNLFEKDLHQALLNTVYVLGIFIAGSLLGFFQSYLFSNLNQNIIFDLKKDMYDKILNLPVKAFDEVNNGEFMSRLHGDVVGVANILTDRLLNGIVDALRLIIVGITVFTISVPMALIAVTSLPFSYFIFLKYGRLLKKKNKEMAELNDKYFSDMGETIWGIREVKCIGIKRKKYESFLYLSEAVKSKGINISVLNSLSQAFSQGVNYITQIAVMALGGFLVITGRLAMQFFVAFNSYVGQLTGSLIRLTQFNSQIQQIVVSLDRIFGLIDGLSYGSETFGEKRVEKIEGNIRFDGITFRYNENSQVLRNISMEIPATSKVAIVGNSGSGKSTVFNLILKLYRADEGKIYIDGIEIDEFSEESLRKHISVIRQDPFLFDGSVKDNLLLANPGASQLEIEEACRRAYIHQYIESLPGGYDTVISENGVSLSGGQRQRIAIARALIKKSRIILFDEATSSLDNESQFYIKKAIDSISINHTIVIIAHRLSTIIEADKIYVMDNGTISGCGKHSYLIRNNPTYKRLYEEELRILKENGEEVV